MKNIFLLFLSFIIINAIYSQSGNSEAEAKDPGRFLSKSSFAGDYSSAVFFNNNLSLNALPQNEPSVRISRFNSNFVVATWRDFRLGYQTTIERG